MTEGEARGNMQKLTTLNLLQYVQISCRYNIHCIVGTGVMHNTVYTVQYVQLLCTTQYSMYRSSIYASYSGTAGNRPLSSRNHYLVNQMRTERDMLHCIYMQCVCTYYMYVYMYVRTCVATYIEMISL